MISPISSNFNTAEEPIQHISANNTAGAGSSSVEDTVTLSSTGQHLSASAGKNDLASGDPDHDGH